MTTYTPTLSAEVSYPDGSTVKARFASSTEGAAHQWGLVDRSALRKRLVSPADAPHGDAAVVVQPGTAQRYRVTFLTGRGLVARAM
ncbi:hypothetical protein ACGFNV_03670 [Streptomyces sp. NPDC048751]|uniref:hypothetical protein n=1 Tax=Streptomyces sp. NPDC048751 TaxID=3365591 RepID=UPI0037188BFB